MKAVIYWGAQSWGKITYSTLNKSWNKLYDGLEYEEEEENYENLVEMAKGIEVMRIKWVRRNRSM